MSYPKRYNVVFFTFILTLLLYIDRVCISAAKGPVSVDLGLDDKQFGWVLSAFALGYALFQAPSGILVDQKGARAILSFIVLLWSLLTALTGAVHNYSSMLLARFLFGAGEAGAFPGISKATMAWFPMSERGLITGINFSGSRLGAAFSMPLVIGLINAFGWRTTFLILGGFGVVWAIAWYFWFRDKPEFHNSVSKEELDLIIKERQKINNQSTEKVSWTQIIKLPETWLVMLQYFGSNYIFFFCLTWLFPFLKNKYQMDDLSLSYWASVPFLAGAFGNYFSGYLVDYLYKIRGIDLSRKLPAMIGFALVAIGLIANLSANTIYTSILFLSVAIFGADMTLSPSWSYCMDVGQKQAGVLSGTMNMAGNLGSFITALAFPYLLSWTGNENTFFYIGIGLSIISLWTWSKLNSSKPILTK